MTRGFAQSGSAIAQGKRPSGFGIYVHWPFCAAKCPYCDFNSHVRVHIDEEAWATGIASELQDTARLQGDSRPIVHSIFFGGGTPSLIGGTSVAAIIDEIAGLWPVSPDVEITLEANPASAEANRFHDYRLAGVNRLSLGVQALNDEDLKFLGRLHDVAEAKAALATACETFDRISLDLIYARPSQAANAWRHELAEALSFGTEHLSLYQLTIEPETPFAVRARNGQLEIPHEDVAAELFEITQEMTAKAGRPAYEISNHAVPGAECRHNLLYWRYGDYAGVGPGAHGRLTLDGRRVETVGEKLPERWRARVAERGNGRIGMNEIGPRQAASEHLLMSLRLTEGLDLVEFRSRWGIEIDRARIESLVEAGLLECPHERLSATPRGRLVLNSVVNELAP